MTASHGILLRINTCMAFYMANKVANMDVKEHTDKTDADDLEYKKIVEACDIW